MKKLLAGTCIAVLLLTQSALAAEMDLRRAVPDNVFLVVYAQHNPERDYQQKHYEEIWKTVQETKIIDRAMNIITSRAPENELAQAKAVIKELHEAASPIDLKALSNCESFVYAQIMQAPTSHHLAMMKVTADAAASTEQGVKNLFGLVEKYSQGNIAVETSTEGDATLTSLSFGPSPVPMSPTIVRLDNVVMMASTREVALKSLKMLVSGEGKSKFDDPRLKEALQHLPEMEDSLVFYDGRTQFDEMRNFGSFIRQMSGNDPDAERAASLIEMIIDEVAIIDYEVTVEYTEGNFNKSAAYGKLMPNIEDKTLTKMFAQGKPFENWQSWVPATATAYSLSTGVTLHPLYEKIMATIDERFPEAKPTLEKFEAIQAQLGVHLDRDILQSFSGESVSVSFPASTPSPMGGADSFTALRCSNPDRIRELLHRAIDKLRELPPVKAQQLQLKDSEELEGFEELSALTLGMMGARPVIGFKDGWMIIGSNAKAVQTIFDTQAGKGETIDTTDAFKQFGIEVKGPVSSISYTNLAESTRGIAQFLNQAGMFVPMIIGMIGAEADSEDLKPIQEAVALLPDVAKIVRKFEFLEAKISVTQEADDPLAYKTHTAVKVSPYTEDE